MAEKTLIYSFVARGNIVLAEYTEYSGNFSTIATQCLSKLPASTTKHTYVCDHHTFNFLIQDGFTFLVVADEDFGRQVPFLFLERVKDDFLRRYRGGLGSADLATPGSLNSEFAQQLKSHMEYVTRHPEEMQKIARIKSQVDEVKGIMMVNIEQVLERDGKIDLLVTKTTDLETGARQFEKQGKQIRRRMWFANFKVKLLVLVILIIIALVIYLSICKGFVCH